MDNVNKKVVETEMKGSSAVYILFIYYVFRQ
jgi:hypothetical protein